MATGSSSSSPLPPPSKTYDLEITIVSAKHLKNVNWHNGDLKPYVIFWVDPDQRRATQSDDSGNTRPVWNERFVLHLPPSPHDSVLTLEIFHSRPSETQKPLVGTVRVPLKEVVDFGKIRTFEIRRPSGRPHGKIKLKLGIREIVPPSYYYSTAPAPHQPPQLHSYRTYPPPSPSPPAYPYGGGGGYSDSYSSYYPGYYSQPPPPPRPFVERQSGYGGGGLGLRPSAPVDYNQAPHSYDPQRSGKMGMGTGLAVGGLAGALGGLALGEGLKYEETKIAERVENNMAARDDYSNYSVEY